MEYQRKYCTYSIIQILPVVSPMAKTILSRAMPSPTVPVSGCVANYRMPKFCIYAKALFTGVSGQ
jgi:hypothetical protein